MKICWERRRAKNTHVSVTISFSAALGRLLFLGQLDAYTNRFVDGYLIKNYTVYTCWIGAGRLVMEKSKHLIRHQFHEVLLDTTGLSAAKASGLRSFIGRCGRQPVRRSIGMSPFQTACQKERCARSLFPSRTSIESKM